MLSKITEEAERLKKQKQDMQEHHEKQLEALQKESERMAKELEVAEKNRIEAERVAKELEVAEKNRIEAENAEKAEQNQQVSCLIFQSFFLISNFKTLIFFNYVFLIVLPYISKLDFFLYNFKTLTLVSKHPRICRLALLSLKKILLNPEKKWKKI